MMHVPLNAALICGTYQILSSQGKKLHNEMTLTALYQEIIEQLLRKYLEDKCGLGEKGTAEHTRQEIQTICGIELQALEFLAFAALQSKEPTLFIHTPRLVACTLIGKFENQWFSSIN